MNQGNYSCCRNKGCYYKAFRKTLIFCILNIYLNVISTVLCKLKVCPYSLVFVSVIKYLLQINIMRFCGGAQVLVNEETVVMLGKYSFLSATGKTNLHIINVQDSIKRPTSEKAFTMNVILRRKSLITFFFNFYRKDLRHGECNVDLMCQIKMRKGKI